MSNFSENDHRKTRCFQHRGVKTRGVLTTWFLVFSTLPAIFNTFLYCIPVRFFHWIPAFLQPLFSLKPYCVPAPNTRKAEGIGLICTHILTWFQHGACVSTSCIPALTASLLRYHSPLKNVRRYCILVFSPRKSANTSMMFSIFRIHSYCVPVFFCVHFHCFGRFSGLLLGCSTFSEAFWTALDCFWALWTDLDCFLASALL